MIGVGISAGLSGAKRPRSIQDPLPALDLDWATDRSLPAAYGPTPSFSRASTGTYFTSSGVLTSSAINGPRFDHVYNGTNWVSKGLLVEEQRTNSSQYTEDLTNAWWTKYSSSISSNSATAPDGNQTADKLVENSVNDQHSIFNSGFSTTAGTAYTISFFAKSAGRNFIQFMPAVSLSGAAARANFDLQSGVLGTVSGTNTTAEIVNVGNGWYRCVTKISSASGNGTAYLQFAMASSASATAGQAYLGDGSSGVLIWGIQLEIGSFPTSYIPTTTAAVTRSADVCSFTGTNFSQWFNQSEGTFSIDFDLGIPSSANYGFPIFAISDVSTNLHRMFFDCTPTDNAFRWYIRHDPSGQSTQLKPGPYAGNYTTQKAAMVYKLDDIAISLNGSSPLTSTTQTVPTGLNQLEFVSNDAFGSGRFNGHISRLRYYPTRLTNAKLQELST
jgi:hypothetical protein